MSPAQMDPTINIAARQPGAEPVIGAPADGPGIEAEATGGAFFRHLLDVINPLQHIPVISTIYRAITGDEISPAAKLAGGTLFGGPIGAAAAVVSIAVEGNTGRDVGEHLMVAIVGDDDLPADAALQQAQSDAAAPAEIAGQPQTLASRPIDTIIWNGLRQTTAGPASDTPAITPTADATPAVDATLAAIMPNTPTAPSTAVPNADTTPSAPWLTTALAQAETVQAANARGDTAARPEPQPWIADAMMQALDQYDALTRQRHRQADSDANP